MSVLGLFHWGVFMMLKPSPLNCSLKRSLIWKLRNTEASTFQNPGPLKTFQPRFPNSGCPPFSAPGCAKHCVVTIGLPLLAKLQMVGVNQVALRPFPLVTGIGPGPNQFKVLLFPGAFRTPALPPKVIGVPEAILMMPFICQPPRAMPTGPEVKNLLPLPNGSS